jgi:flagellar biogenesis protein FliO
MLMVWQQLGQIALSFLCVIALMFALSWCVRRFGLEKKWHKRESASGLLKIHDSLFLDPRRRLVLIGMHDKHYLLLLDNERSQLLDICASHENIAPSSP